MKPSKTRSWLSVLVGALIALEALYLFAANVFLRTSLFDKVLNGNPEEIQVKTQAATSWFPGWVHVGQVQVRGQDSNVQWLVQVDHARLWVSLSDLAFRRSFHVTKLDAEAGAFQIRTRKLGPGYGPNDVLELPPIPGFGPETLLKTRAEAEKRLSELKDRLEPKTDSGLRQIRIENIHIPGFNQIWFGGYRFDGKIDVTGLFTVNLGRQLVIPHGRLEFLSGGLTRLDRSILQNLGGVIDASIRDFQIKQDHGLDIFKTVGAQVALHGGLRALDPLSFMIKNQDWFQLQETSGDFSVQASVRDGRVVAVPEAKLIADSFRASFSHYVIEGAAKVGLYIEPAGLGVFGFSLPSYRVFSDHAAASQSPALIDGHALKIALTSPDLDLAHLYKRVTAQVTLPDARIGDLRFLNHWIPPSSGVQVKQGSAQVSADFAVSNDSHARVAPGWAVVDADHVQMKRDDHDVIGKVRVFGHVAQVFHESTHLKELSIAGSEVHVFGSLADGSKAWKTDIQVKRGLIRPDEDPVIRGHVAIDMPDVGPFLSEFGVQSGLGKIAQNLLESGRFEGSTDIQLDEGWLKLDRVRLVSERSRVVGFLHLHDKAKEAIVLIHMWPLTVGFELNGEGTHVHLLGAEDWYKNAVPQMAGQADDKKPLN